MKILSLVGTRPELIRLNIIIEKLDGILKTNHIFVYTNQNYDKNLSDIFFKDLDIRKPDYVFDIKDSFCEFISNAFLEFDAILKYEKPDKILTLGDTNTGLLTILAQKYNIPVYHMEAGNRCFDNRVPEEVNRRVIDNLSTINMPYTENARQNLLSEKFHKNNIYKTGNPIFEVLTKYRKNILDSNILNILSLTDEYKEAKDFILVTCHRSENVDNIETLTKILTAINYMAEKYKVIFSIHPRTRSKINEWFFNQNILLHDPFGFFDFVCLEKNAKLVISDSGTVQEECAIFKTPCLVIRESTERHELIECGSSILIGTETQDIINTFNNIINRNNARSVPEDYLVRNVSETVINILLGK